MLMLERNHLENFTVYLRQCKVSYYKLVPKIVSYIIYFIFVYTLAKIEIELVYA